MPDNIKGIYNNSVPYTINGDGTAGTMTVTDPKDGSHHTIWLSRNPNTGHLKIASMSTGLVWPSSVDFSTAESMANPTQKQDLQKLVQLVHDAESTITRIINEHNNVSTEPKAAEQGKPEPQKTEPQKPKVAPDKKYYGVFSDQDPNAKDQKWEWASKGAVQDGLRVVPKLTAVSPVGGDVGLLRKATQQPDGTVKFTYQIASQVGKNKWSNYRDMTDEDHKKYDPVINQAQDAFAQKLAASAPASHAAPATDPSTKPEPAGQKPTPAKAGPQPDKSSAHHPYPNEVVRFGKHKKFALNLKRDKDGQPVMKNGEWVVSTDRHTTVRQLVKGPKRAAALKALRQKIHRAKTAHDATAAQNYQHMLNVVRNLPHVFAAPAHAVAPAGAVPHVANRPPYADILHAATEPLRIFGVLPSERGDSSQRAALRLHKGNGEKRPAAKQEPAPETIQALGPRF